MSFTELDADRQAAGMGVSNFCERFGIPTSTWYRWRQSGSAGKGPWPRPVGDAIETAAKDKATRFDAWGGHRELAELLRIEDGLSVSDSTVYRVLDRLGLCLPANYTGESVSSPRSARRPSSNRRSVGIGSGGQITPSSRPMPAAPGISAASSTTGRR